MFWNQLKATISPTMITGKKVFSSLVLAVLCQSALAADADRFITAHRLSGDLRTEPLNPNFKGHP